MVSIMPFSPAGAQVQGGGEIPAASTDGFANFRTHCAFSHSSFDDPIMHPGEPGGAHQHFFFGNTTANAFSTPESLRASGSSTCQGASRNKSAYWMPALFTAEGQPMIPDGNSIYYKHLNDEPATTVQALPEGLMMIAGNADGTPENQVDSVTYWDCLNAPTNFPASDTMPDCPQGAKLGMTVNFPPCWNGTDLDSADHKSHMAYPSYDRVPGEKLCPATHPIPVPQVIMTFSWNLREQATTGWYLSSDMGQPNGSSLHADWMNGWHQPTMDFWTARCIRQVLNCDGGALGDGRSLTELFRMGSETIPKAMNASPGRYCNGRRATIVGTAGDDVIMGTPGDDVIVGGNGNDEIDGGEGNDIICGQQGDDILRGNNGNDEIHGQAGADNIDGGRGDDFMRGGGGDDIIFGQEGVDVLRGDAGDDTLDDFSDKNVLIGSAGNDTITGGWWKDRIFGGAGNDIIHDRGGEAAVWGGPGIDTCTNAVRGVACE